MWHVYDFRLRFYSFKRQLPHSLLCRHYYCQLDKALKNSVYSQNNFSVTCITIEGTGHALSRETKLDRFFKGEIHFYNGCAFLLL